MQELSLAGIKLDRDEVIERGFLTHFYVAPFAKDSVITNIFKQAGFDEMRNPSKGIRKVKYFEKVNRVLFWKGHEYLTIEKKADHLEIVVAERR